MQRRGSQNAATSEEAKTQALPARQKKKAGHYARNISRHAHTDVTTLVLIISTSVPAQEGK
jgi:hypothetical protein